MTLKIIRHCLLAATVLLVASPVMAQTDTAYSDISKRDMREFRRLMPGIYTNEEQVNFQESLGVAKEDQVMRMDVVVTRTGESFTSVITWADGRTLEARHEHSIVNGKIQANAIRNGRMECARTVTRTFETFTAVGCDGPFILSPKGISLTSGDKTYILLRSRPFTCWVSPRKTDGSYAFYNNLVLHDQGGRVWIDATADHPRVGLKLRNVTWPTGVNRDSMALYTYQGQDEVYSPGYAWGDPKSERLAINTRWIQASCTQGNSLITPTLNLTPGRSD
ncbi:hypothetical protein GCM10009069_00360 [Algimonas arctica]|uniref:Outer membrane lipoprotein-sorting protein n=1 Tax=Algimonas arctica TaxID=1479486 RepID=A0A8J3CP98_9PROT|nr:hypothetical protein [Algimonas arctica]GHA81320.1 hypothetical protein GCM10009069_00360 [Algimonas arctica]